MFVIYANDSVMTTKINYASEGLTLTNLVTPFCCIVAPYKRSHSSIVPSRCVTTINCVVFENSFKYLANLSTLAISNAASTSSKIHIGTGRTFKIANKHEIAIKAFSPPENNVIF